MLVTQTLSLLQWPRGLVDQGCMTLLRLIPANSNSHVPLNPSVNHILEPTSLKQMCLKHQPMKTLYYLIYEIGIVSNLIYCSMKTFSGY